MPVEGKAYNLINKNFNCALDMYNGIPSIGNTIITYQFWNSTKAYNQLWYIGKVPATSNYLILSTYSDLALDKVGNFVTQQTLTCNLSQQFEIGLDSHCNFYIRSVLDNKTLTEVSQNALCHNMGTTIVPQPNAFAQQQKWSFVEMAASKLFINQKFILNMTAELLLAAWKPAIPDCGKLILYNLLY